MQLWYLRMQLSTIRQIEMAIFSIDTNKVELLFFFFVFFLDT